MRCFTQLAIHFFTQGAGHCALQEDELERFRPLSPASKYRDVESLETVCDPREVGRGSVVPGGLFGSKAHRSDVMDVMDVMDVLPWHVELVYQNGACEPMK